MKPGDKVVFVGPKPTPDSLTTDKLIVGKIYTIKYLYDNTKRVVLEEYDYRYLVDSEYFITLKQKIIKDILNDH